MCNVKRLLITDMDHTLLDEDSRISPENLEAIAGFVRRGGLFTVATGRAGRAVRIYSGLLEQIGAPVILYNGGALWDFETGRALFEELVPAGARPVLDGIAERFPGIGIIGLRGDGACHLKDNPHTLALKERERYEPDIPAEAGASMRWNKIILAGDDGDLPPVEAFIRRQGLAVRTVISEPHYLEILAERVNKGRALRLLAERCGVPAGRVVAVGDGLNDLEMLRFAGLGVAVGNAHPALKAAADACCADNRHSAVRDVIERFRLP